LKQLREDYEKKQFDCKASVNNVSFGMFARKGSLKMSIDPYVEEIGEALVMSAEQDESFSKQRGRVDELFPYIYRASKRMSTRAISRWLMEARNVKLSAVTIAKALRESDRYWLSYYDEVEPASGIVARAYGFDDGRQLLEDEDLFARVTGTPPAVSGPDGLDEYNGAVHIVLSQWFNLLDAPGREECLAAVYAAERKEEAEEGKKNEAGSK
jgi:predicted nucleic acid-binding protein